MFIHMIRILVVVRPVSHVSLVTYLLILDLSLNNHYHITLRLRKIEVRERWQTAIAPKKSSIFINQSKTLNENSGRGKAQDNNF